ncbi:hypothetical protein KQI84_01990 [bacterium]|nr:hypothetical protein [bacterium]
MDPRSCRKCLALRSLFGGVALSCFLAIASAASAQDIAGAMLGRVQLTPEELVAADKSGDGVVDSADLRRQTDEGGAPKVSFAAATTTTEEGNQQIEIEVYFDRPFSGTVEWSVGGTASAGQDYVGTANSMTVNGVDFKLPIEILDDSTVEQDAETIELLLLDTANYDLGAPQVHTVYLQDNDRTWDGTIQSGFFNYGFTMEILRNGSNTTAKLMSDGNGSFAAGEYNLMNVFFTDQVFTADSVPISVSPDELLFRRGMQRTLEFRANKGDEGVLIKDGFVGGHVTERVSATSADDSYLDRSVVGTFTMMRRPQAVPQTPPDLVRGMEARR